MSEETVPLIPDPARTMEGLRDMGYSFETAIADLVDNSIAANATLVDISVQLDFRGHVRVAIVDNGEGMDRQRLQDAMTYGSIKRPDPASLGKFGLGLKTASTAWCRRLSVVSRSSGSESPMMATWDMDYVAECGEWLLLMTDEPDPEAVVRLEDAAPDHAGTVVLWTKVDRLLRSYSDPTGRPARNALAKRCDDLRFHLSMTYQRFLDPKDGRARNIRIVLNGERVTAWDPFQEGVSELVASETQPVETGGKFQVRAFILPRREEFADSDQEKNARISPDRQGIYIYRESRLIHSADWLGMFRKEPHLNLLRVEFSFDHRLDDALQLDVRKSQIRLDDSLLAWLDRFSTAPRREANRRYRKGRVRAIDEKARQGVHQASNNTIKNKEAQVGGPKIKVDNAATGDVTVTNGQGTFSLKLPVTSATTPGQVHVEPTDDVADGVLFEPALIEMHKAVRINTRHPYYHKVYVPNHNDSVTVQGLDSLLWALCVAELSTTSDSDSGLFNDMRFEVSRILRKLVEGLPEPADSDISDGTDAD